MRSAKLILPSAVLDQCTTGCFAFFAGPECSRQCYPALSVLCIGEWFYDDIPEYTGTLAGCRN